MAASPYKLSCSLFGHTLDVRSVAVTPAGKIISGSRDMTAKVWAPNEYESGYREVLTFAPHNNFVSCVCVLPPSSKYPGGLIVTGSNDQIIRLFDESLCTPIQVLKSHTNTVCKISPGIEENSILSSSWDQTSKLWDLVTCKDVMTFSGHSAAIWSVIQLTNGCIVTASADKLIKVWLKDGTNIRTLTGHTDCVRDLAAASSNEVLSCSNDATVRLWNTETGQCLNTFYGHGNFIYSISTISGSGVNGFITSSEDKSVKLWCNGEVIETIQIPASSVWSAAALPNGDIVTGSSDGVVRVFSADPARQTSPEQLKAYDDQLAALVAPAVQEIGGVKVTDLPGKEALYEPGKTDGQTKMVRENGGVIAYSWSSAEGRWDKIGDVMGSANNEPETGKSMYDGKEYDYVFTVDIEDGKPPLKLPYNKSEDPWFAAQKFIHDNHLSQHFLEQVANFIITNASAAAQTSSTPTDFVDPFTGSARYIPQIEPTSNGVPSANSDPFTGTSRYKPTASVDITSLYFPQREFLRFDQANLNIILEKLLEFNKRSGDGSQVLKETQIEDLVKICEPGATCKAEDILTLDRLLEWPQEIVFPVLDVMRLAIRNHDANSFLCTEDLIPSLMKFLNTSPNNMLTFRVLNNMLTGEQGLALASGNKIKLLNIIRDVSPPHTKPLQVAMATLLLNISVILRRSDTPEGRSEALKTVQHVLPILTDQEALFRGLVALGTLLVDSLDRKNYSAAFKPILTRFQNDSSLGPKIQECSHQIITILQ